MKCVKYIGLDKGHVPKQELYGRIEDLPAAVLVATGDWAYCPKQEYKEAMK